MISFDGGGSKYGEQENQEQLIKKSRSIKIVADDL